MGPSKIIIIIIIKFSRVFFLEFKAINRNVKISVVIIRITIIRQSIQLLCQIFLDITEISKIFTYRDNFE